MKIGKLVFALMLIILSLVFIQPSVKASVKDEWLQVRSKNFNLIGNASEKDIRKVATKLEQFRETFRQIFTGMRFDSNIPTNVIVFKSGDSYKPFKPKRADGKIDNFVAGYFQAGEDVNYITLSTDGEDAETYGTIFHEYVHFLVETNYGKSEVPPWFNEGLAEYYQTFEIKEDQKVNLGYFQQVHVDLLNQSKLIPLDTLFKISNYSLHQNGNHSRSIFYAQSWALIHSLIQGGKGESLGKFLALILKDVPPEKAFQEIFQTTYAQAEKDLRKYVEQRSYKYVTITFKNKLLFDNEMKTSPLGEAESQAYLGDLLYHTNRIEDSEPFLQKAVQLSPNSSMANTTLGMLKIRQRKYDDAKSYLEKAISEDQKNHLAFYRYAYLLSREGRDDYGFVSSYPADTSSKMREMLKKSITIDPAFTESYELLAFVNLVNGENLDEAVSYMQKALKYQPGNQRYALRIAEINLRQEKFDSAAVIAQKIALTADDPQIKSEAENLVSQLKQRREMLARQEEDRKRYESTASRSDVNMERRPPVRRNPNKKPPTPEEIAKYEEDLKIFSVNQSLIKPQENEKQVIGQVLKIECKGKSVIYTVKSDNETFTLTSKDFESLALTAYVADAENVQIGCGAKIADINSVLTYKSQPDAKKLNRGELIALDIVPKSFRFMDTSKPLPPLQDTDGEEPPTNLQDLDARRRESAIRGIKEALRKPLGDEKQNLAFIEQIECGKEGIFFHMKTQTETIKLFAVSPQAVQVRGYTPEIQQIRFGCGLKQVDVPVVFIYRPDSNSKGKASGELLSLEFVPKGFALE